MMGQRSGAQDKLFYSFSLEEHVPDDHLLRGINSYISLFDAHRNSRCLGMLKHRHIMQSHSELTHRQRASHRHSLLHARRSLSSFIFASSMGIHCILVALSVPPPQSGREYLVTYPGQSPLVLPVEGQAYSNWNLSAVEGRVALLTR